MLCEASSYLGFTDNFWVTWAVITVLGWVVTMILSSLLFLKYYVNPTFNEWKWKVNPVYPDAKMVRLEILQLSKGLTVASICPTLSLWFSWNGWTSLSKAYCGMPEGRGWRHQIMVFIVMWIASDFLEWAYHWCGHKFKAMWHHHKAHHVFFNPTPFAVIADEYLDQFMRSLPVLIFPMIYPVNMDSLYFQYAGFFYAYGVYLHYGHEVSFLSAHNPYINTSYHHYLHHAVSIINKPYHTGFFLKCWDQLAGSVYTKKCLCVRCEAEAGNRTKEQFAAMPKPDYSPLLSWKFWWHGA